ncbi:hypothetical protein Tco_0790917 [Tanacetum coccineum]
MTITRSGMTPEAIEELINRRVEEALAGHEATRAANALEAENQRQNGSDSDNGDGENGNGENGNGGNGNPNENGRGDRPVARECTYQDFMKCQPFNFKGTKGVVGLISALTWWNSHKRTIGTEAAFSMSWRELMKLMTKLTMICTKMVPEEEDRVEKIIGGLPDNIQGNVIAAKPTRLQDAVRIANNLMDQNLKGYVVKNAENKRRLKVNQRDNRGQQPPIKGQMLEVRNKARAYTLARMREKLYNASLPLSTKSLAVKETSFRCPTSSGNQSRSTLSDNPWFHHIRFIKFKPSSSVVPTYHQDEDEDAHAIQDDNPAITKLIHVEYARDDIAKTEMPIVIEEDEKLMIFTSTKVYELSMENKSIDPKEVTNILSSRREINTTLVYFVTPREPDELVTTLYKPLLSHGASRDKRAKRVKLQN